MSCPDLPLVIDAWNVWIVQSTGDVDAGGVKDWTEDLFSDLDGTGVHDVDVQTASQGKAIPEGVESTLWRRTECDPLPVLQDVQPYRMWIVQFVARGADQGMPGKLATRSDEIVPEFVFLARKELRERGVPDEPPGFLDRLGEKIEKGVEKAQAFYGGLAVVAVVVAVLVFTKSAKRAAA